MYAKFSYVFRPLAIAISLRFASLNSKRCIGVWLGVRVDLAGKINRVWKSGMYNGKPGNQINFNLFETRQKTLGPSFFMRKSHCPPFFHPKKVLTPHFKVSKKTSCPLFFFRKKSCPPFFKVEKELAPFFDGTKSWPPFFSSQKSVCPPVGKPGPDFQ